jgi:hypothetical protein
MRVLRFSLAILILEGIGGASGSPFGPVTVSKPFFNPTNNQSVEISFGLAQPASVSVSILDRDAESSASTVHLGISHNNAFLHG